MMRMISATLAVLLLLTTSAIAADGPAGSWKLTFPRSNLTFLIKVEEKDGKWSAQYLGSNQSVIKVAMGDTVVTPDSIRFSLKIAGEADLNFDGRLPADPKTGKIAGSLQIRSDQLVLAFLEPSKLKTYDKFEFNKEVLEQSTDPSYLLDAALDLIGLSAEKKAKPEDVRIWADKAYRPAEAYGTRWQKIAAIRLAQALSAQKDLAPVAIEYARKVERLLDPDDDLTVQMETLETVAQILAKAGKPEDAKVVAAKAAKLEERDYAEYMKKAPFKPEPYEGRKAKSDRTVLVELFTGTAVAPGAAAGAAFDALEKTYKPSEVILIQYHLQAGQESPPEFLSNPTGLERARSYKLRGIPFVYLNGKAGPQILGPIASGQAKYRELRDAINPLLEKPADAKIELTATRKGEEISVKANYADVAKVGENIHLRFLVVDDRVRLSGGNGLRYQHFVARAFVGGPKGFVVAKKSGEQTATLNLDTVRTEWNKIIDEMTGGDPEVSRPDRLIKMANVHVVAVIQDDETGDVLQAVQVEVK